MAYLLTIAFLLPLSRFLGADAGFAVASDDAGGTRKPLMRLHGEPPSDASAHHITAAGEFVAVKEKKTDPVPTPAPAGDTVAVPSPPPPQISEAECADFCCNSYILGIQSTNTCIDGEPLHRVITQESQCEDAAKKAGARQGDCLLAADCKAGEKLFTLDNNFVEKYPMGCFQSATDTNLTFYYNPIGVPASQPGNQSATPVCRRERYRNGTVDTNAGCPTTQYSRIHNLTDCRSFAACEGYCIHDTDFIVGEAVVPIAHDPQPDDPRMPWASFYNEMPSGCFIRPEDGCVYFNTPKADEPTAPKGMPVCHVDRWATGTGTSTQFR